MALALSHRDLGQRVQGKDQAVTERKKAQQLKGKRLGFVLASVHSGSSLQLWPPLLATTERSGTETFIFPGGRLGAADPGEAHRNRLFDLVSPANLDGILSWASSLGGFIDLAELDAFHARWDGLPLVAMAHRLPGRPVVRIDAYSGMIQLLRHFREVHGVSRFAFIRGPLEHESSGDRWRAFQDFHRDSGLELDTDLVASPRPWNEGQQALEELLDSRNLMPGRDFEALVSTSDLPLYEAVLSLQSRGFVIPKDLLVAGFNDNLESRILSPTVTTVRMPFPEQVERAFAALASLLVGEAVEADQILSSELIIRRSCGCLSPSVRNAGISIRTKAFVANIDDDRRRLRDAVMDAAVLRHKIGEDDRSAWLDPLADNFLIALEKFRIARDDKEREEAAFIFLRTLERVTERLVRMERDLEPWQDVLSALRREALASYETGAALVVEDLVGQARVVVAEAAERAHAYSIWKSGRMAQAIRELEKDLILLDERSNLSAALAAHLPELEIRAAYVVEDSGGSDVRLIAGFDERGPMPLGAPIAFARGLLLPPDFLAPAPGRTWIVEPLSASDGYFGHLVLRAGTSDGTIYEELRGAVSSAIQGLRAIDALREARAAAVKAEALKTRFLANVSAELRSPLHQIIRNIDKALSAIEKRRGGTERTGDLRLSLETIRLDARRQLRLTDDLLDLSRSEVGELDLELRLIRPERLMAHAMEAAGGVARIVAPPAQLPCLVGDEGRLSRSLALLIETVAPADIEIMVEPRALVIGLSRSASGVAAVFSEASRTSALSPGPALAKRLVSAHYGRLESFVDGGAQSAWRVRLPFPAFGGGASSASDENGPVIVLSSENTLSAELESVMPFAARALALDAEQLLNGADDLPPDSALIWDGDHNGGAEALIILAVNRKYGFGRRPFLFFPPAALADLSRYTAPSEAVEAIAGKVGTGAILVCDGDRERRQAFLDLLQEGSPFELIGIGSVRELSNLRRGLFPSLAILRVSEPDFLKGFRDNPSSEATLADGGAETVGLLVIGSHIGLESEMDLYLTTPRTLVLNDGIFDPKELRTFVRALASGRPILPPYTGAVVKNAIRYMNAHLSSAISRWKLAEAVHVSEDYLTRIFRKELGMSPWDYLTRLRIHAASQLLRGGTESIRSIAALTGFQDQAYFCRVFRKVTGRSPSAYRENA